jgi:hypothetical protein
VSAFFLLMMVKDVSNMRGEGSAGVKIAAGFARRWMGDDATSAAD